MNSLWVLGYDNHHIIAALDLYKEVMEDKEDPERFLKQKQNILYKKVSSEDAQNVFIKKGIKLPGMLND